MCVLQTWLKSVITTLVNPGSREVATVFNKTPWAGDPRVNIQNKNGKAKLYQVKQILSAIEKLEAQSDD